MLDFIKSFLPYKIFPAWSEAYTISLSFLGAYRWEYSNSKFWLIPSDKTPSSSETIVEFFWKRLTFQDCIFVLNSAKSPVAMTFIAVVLGKYPMPDSITLTLINCPFSIIGVSTAPKPSPSIVKFGGELYPLPEEFTKTSIILPFEIIGITFAPEPLFKVINGCLL